MSIYDGVGASPDQSLATKQACALNDLTVLIVNNFNQLQGIYQKGYDILNNNPSGLTRDQIVAAMGDADWQKFYIEAMILKTLINHCVPGTIVDQIGEIPLG